VSEFLPILISVLVITWVVMPFLLTRPHWSGQREAAMEDERVLSLLRSLKQLRQGQSRDIADDDYQQIENRLMLEIARIYKRRGIKPDHVGLCTQCGQQLKGDEPFCGQCGHPQETQASDSAESCPECDNQVESTHRFCPNCGHKLQDAQ